MDWSKPLFLTLYKIAIVLLSFFLSSLICKFQLSLLSTIRPRYFIFFDSNNFVLLIVRVMRTFLVPRPWKIINSVFPELGDYLLAHNQSKAKSSFSYHI